MLQRKKVFKLLTICMMFMFSMLFTSGLAKAEQAKPELSDSEITIGIGTYGSGSFYFHKTNDKYEISVNNPLEDAQYSFTSSNKDIVTVEKSGSKAYLTGIKKGTTYITCKQIFNGETTTVGKCKVMVNNSTLQLPNNQVDLLSIGSAKLGSWVQAPLCDIDYRIPDAKYTYTTTSKYFTMKDVKYNETNVGEGYFGFKQEYVAKKAGTYKVTVKETYKGKTRTVGSFKVTVHDLEIEKNYIMPLNTSVRCDYLIGYPKTGKSYYFEGDGFDANKKTSKSVVFIDNDQFGEPQLSALKDGTATIKIYEGTNKSNKKYVGSSTIIVKRDFIDFRLYDGEYETYIGHKYATISLRTSPDVTLDDIKVTSSDKSILTVKYSKEENECILSPNKAGTVTLVVKKGKETISCTVTVYETEEAYKKATGY